MSTANRLEHLADRLELADLVSRLGGWLDDLASAQPADLLAADVTVRSPGGVAHGRDAVVAQATRTHDGRATQHLMTDVLAVVDGDEAQVTANLLVVFGAAAGDSAPQWVSGARYRFGARRHGVGWRLASIEVAPVWQVGERPTPATD